MGEESRVRLEAARVITEALLGLLGERLVSVVLYGSVSRMEVHELSDIDLLIVLDNAPMSRFERLKIFEEAERRVEEKLERLERRHGVRIDFSPIIKSREEAGKFTPLYLDLTEDGVILYDREGFMKSVLGRVRRRLLELGAKRVWRGKKWYWVLKPRIKPGEVIEIE